MGWFLFSSKKKTGKGKGKGGSKATGKKADPLAPRRWDPARTLANIWIVGWIVLLGGGAGAWYFGESYLMGYVAERHADQPVTVELVDTPEWMDEQLLGRLRLVVEEEVSRDPFDQPSLDAAARRLAQLSWVEGVQRIIREPGNQVVVYATYRRPAALIEAADGFHLVDAQGVRLPVRYAPEHAAGIGLILIEGVRQAPPAAGNRWSGDDVQAALQLAEVVRQAEWAEEVAAIDVRNYGGRVDSTSPHLLLPTRRGGLVRWGRALGEEQFYEPPAQTKLRHIDRVWRQSATVCAGGRVVDIFRDQIHTHNVDAINYSGRNVRYTLTGE